MVGIKTVLAHSNNHGGKRNTKNIKYIVIHYTANDGDTDQANAKYYQQPLSRRASAHYFCDDDSITQSVKDDVIAYSVGGSKWTDCGKTGGGKLYKIATNSNSISIEMCDTIRDGKYGVSAKTLVNVYDLAAMLMRKYNIDIDHVIRHFDVNGKHCPAYYMDSAKWQEFKNNLMKVYNGGSANAQTAVGGVTEAAQKAAQTASQAATAAPYSFDQFVRDVQKAIGTAVDGKVGPKTIGATPTISRSKNNRHAVVKAVQRYLNSIGYNCGAVDGIAGSKFDAAVKAYQKAVVGLSNPDGEFTAKGKSWKTILKYVEKAAAPKPAPAPAPKPAPAPAPANTGYSFDQFVRDVQGAIGTAVDGKVGPKTIGATPTISRSKNNRHAVVKFLQRYLNQLGYNCGAVDGVAGPKFDAAVKAYQRAVVGLSNPDGEFTARGKSWKRILNYNK